MAKYLVIVESPAKVKTIKKFLGPNYEVAASNGHVRDLPKSQLGVDVEHDYEPKYITIRGKGDVLANLRKGIPNYFQRDYEECRERILEKCPRNQYGFGGCPTGEESS